MFFDSVAPLGRKVDIMQKIVIHSLEELVEVFPSLTENQIIVLFQKCTYEHSRINNLLGLCRNDLLRDALFARASVCDSICEFLSGYLARVYCENLGFRCF